MYRVVLALLLVGLCAVEPMPTYAQDVIPNPQLQERLRDIPGEAGRFLRTKGAIEPSAPYLIPDIPIGTAVEVRLRSGESMFGLLAGIDKEDLFLNEGRRIALQEIALLQMQQPAVGVSGTLNWKFVLIVCGAVTVALVVTYFAIR